MTTLDTVVIPRSLEMWGGAECSYVRVQERYSDQFASTGHDDRLEDLDAFASLGIRALRYPISWERMASGRIDWDWAERRLGRLHDLGIKPIVGFVHHGSGPLPGGLLDPDFAHRLGEYAHEVATRFPWVDAYTPVNEPGTTSRFSGLYGVWYPHRSDDAAFVRCLLNQIEGTRRAMSAIRAINAGAQLIQTEDVGKTHSTARLEYQADFENERRWLSFDLLSGRVDERHPLFDYLRRHGMADEEFARLLDAPCTPNILGMNYYITSERFLDDRLHHYPLAEHGGNVRHRYADVAAVRVRTEGVVGPLTLVRELWERYGLPIAITEVQMACTREEQLRWLLDIWQQAAAARNSGVEVRAVTAWALLGAYEWDSLLTRTRGVYESGAFDLRAPRPRPTAVAGAIKALATHGKFVHPVVSATGWWHRPERTIYPSYSSPRTGAAWTRAPAMSSKKIAPLLVIGARGRIGRGVIAACATRMIHVIPVLRDHGDLTQISSVRRLIQLYGPWAVVNCAGFTQLDAAELDHETCERENVLLAAALAEACAERETPFLTFSSDQVFDGDSTRPYLERDATHPLNIYGRSKCEAERRILSMGDGALVVRVGAPFGAEESADFVALTVRAFMSGQIISATAEHIVSPTFIPELVAAAIDLLIDGEEGLWHLANSGSVTWFDWACEIARLSGYAVDHVRPVTPLALGWTATRPHFSALQSERGQLLGPWQDALARHLAQLDTDGVNLAA